jgi:beta-lactamase superfamily II metal-dependent hydrolase
MRDGAAIWRTDQNGAITIRSDGNRIAICSMLGESKC